MAISESRKTANAKWDKANIATLGCKVKKKEAEAFKAYAKGQGKAANAVLRDYVYDCINQDKSGPERVQAKDTGLSPAIAEHIKRTGETPEAFTERAIESTMQRDKASFRLGIPPVLSQEKTASQSENGERDG